MWARITTYAGDAARLEEVREFVTRDVIPVVHGLAGCVGAYWLADHEGKLLAVTLWETRDALDCSEQVTSSSRSRFTQVGATVERVERFEVLARVAGTA